MATPPANRQMPEYTTAADGMPIAMRRCTTVWLAINTYGPAQGLSDSKVGTFIQAIYAEGQQRQLVISIKSDCKHIFAFTKIKKIGKQSHLSQRGRPVQLRYVAL
jgi:hypothetical protein